MEDCAVRAYLDASLLVRVGCLTRIVGVGNVEVFKFAVAIKLLHLELCLLQFVLT